MSASIRFAKGHGTENDFILLLDPERTLDLTPRLVAMLCDRRAGLGADGVLRVVLAGVDPEGAPLSDRARWFMDHRNADGSVAEMCGNGVRVFARYLVDQFLEPAGELAVATRGGIVQVRLAATGDVTVEMGRYVVPEAGAVKVAVDGHTWPAIPVLMPNPHVVAFVEDLSLPGTLARAPLVEPDVAFPEGVNVEFAVRHGPRHLAMRVHERGVGETRSCGTGACAVAVAAALELPSATGQFRIEVPGGRLDVALRDDRTVALTGPAELVAEGVIDREWLDSHH